MDDATCHCALAWRILSRDIGVNLGVCFQTLTREPNGKFLWTCTQPILFVLNPFTLTLNDMRTTMCFTPECNLSRGNSTGNYSCLYSATAEPVFHCSYTHSMLWTPVQCWSCSKLCEQFVTLRIFHRTQPGRSNIFSEYCGTAYEGAES